MVLEIRVERGRCIGARSCMNTAEGVFRLDDSFVAVVVDPTAAPEDDVVAAAGECPTHAISVFKDGERLA